MKKEYTTLYFELSSFELEDIVCISDTEEAEDDIEESEGMDEF